MIIAATGEVFFSDGARVLPHLHIQQIIGTFAHSPVHKRSLPVPGWTQHLLGIHGSDFGNFTVEVVSDSENRVSGVFLSHAHSFYDQKATDDGERRIFHEEVVLRDLMGQQEFSWGHVFYRVDMKENRDWLVLVYTSFAEVPLQARESYRRLFEHEDQPEP